MPTNVFGIDIGTRFMKVALLEKGLRGYEIKSLEARSVEGLDAGGVTGELKSVLAGMGYDSDDDRVAALFPAEKLSSRTIFVPLTKRQQIKEALSYEIESLTPFDAEDIVCDYIPVKTSAGGTLLMVWVALKEDISSFLKIFHDAGVDPEMLAPAPFAAAPMIRAGEGGEALLDIGYSSTSVVIMKDGVPIAFHNAPAGTGLALPAREGGEPIPGIKDFAASVAVEIRRLENAAGRIEGGASVGRVIAVGGGADIPGVRSSLEDELGVRVENVEWAGDVEKGMAFAGAIGGALSLMGEGTKTGVNLGGAGLDKRKRLSKGRTQATLAAAFLGLVALSYIASFAADQTLLNGQYEALRNSVRNEFRRALPDVRNIVSEKQQLMTALEEMRMKSRALGGGLGEKDMFLSRLNDLSAAAPKEIKLDVDELVYEPEKIIMSGRTESFEKVELLKKNMEKLGWTKKVSVERAKAALATGAINFRLEIEIKG